MMLIFTQVWAVMSPICPSSTLRSCPCETEKPMVSPIFHPAMPMTTGTSTAAANHLQQSSCEVAFMLHARNRDWAWMTKEEFGVVPPLQDSFAEGSPVTLQDAGCSKDICDFSAPKSLVCRGGLAIPGAPDAGGAALIRTPRFCYCRRAATLWSPPGVEV
ncbi:hypothetical protein CABS01_09556 [Colletotrichum abscissum]|uniref:uncharacterized protein n=1 Tax=Colletotrichum abscissum TaxID=1671311 RepID=UPI0027D69C44|nr:uncharacterized protein CABS01_09556 [Colletotrichum abscissum]KAK1501825.1 hypothetical protein CABS01_09556 [Colletotrichum abscissum]